MTIPTVSTTTTTNTALRCIATPRPAISWRPSNDPAFTRFGLPVALTATQVVVTTPPPASVTAGGPFSLTVTAEDDAGNVDTTYNGPVMLILNGSDATATLGGTLVGDDGATSSTPSTAWPPSPT